MAQQVVSRPARENRGDSGASGWHSSQSRPGARGVSAHGAARDLPYPPSWPRRADLLELCKAGNGPLKIKYSVRDSEARRRYGSLLQQLFEALGRHGDGTIDLERFLSAETKDVIGVEHSIFELSRLVSGLAAVDGAVVLNKRFELMGFGAEVSGELPYPEIVEQALDVEGERRSAEPANSVGTRHRAAYRFLTAHPAGLAIVISMDGMVRFVANIEGKIVYWDQFLNW
jgi:hypothetical protein